jgi:hypothetical protein
MKGVLGHSSVSDCQNCDLTNVKKINKKFFPTKSGPLRTDESFQQRLSLSHHHVEYQLPGSHVLKNAGIKMVSQFVLDPMHLLDLGVIKKIFKARYTGYFHQGLKLSAEQQLILNMRFSSFSALAPTAFARYTRILAELAHLKAIDWRKYELYTGRGFSERYP